MTEKPAWLPPLLLVDGLWDDVLSRLYEVFDTDFRRGKPQFNELPVWWNRRVLPGEKYEEGFWHLISRNDKETTERLFDPRRAERLPWCSTTIRNNGEDIVKVWDYKEAKGLRRTYLWLEAWDYVIVLEKRNHSVGKVAFLVTAFYVDGNSRKERLRAKYRKRLA
jgi:hypothetical protein